MKRVLDRLLDGQSLTEDEASALLVALTDENLPPATAGALLAALRAKGETAVEIRGFARAMRRLARRPRFDSAAPAVDVVGTGGDGSGSLNLSTGTALLAAACGVRVIKHGNRSISSRSGSADVLEELGFTLPLDEKQAAIRLRESGFTFLFAPAFHPAMRSLAEVRGALGVRTVFNVLGPLTNPAEPDYHLLGAYSSDVARLMAEALSGLPIRRGFVVHGAEGWDEATPVGPFQLFDVRPGRVDEQRRDPRDAGLTRCSADALAGGDAEHNARRLRDVLEGNEAGPHRDALLLGAGLVLELMGEVESTAEGVVRARAVVDDGTAKLTLQKIVRDRDGG